MTVYSVPGSRFWRTVEVVLPDTCAFESTAQVRTSNQDVKKEEVLASVM